MTTAAQRVADDATPIVALKKLDPALPMIGRGDDTIFVKAGTTITINDRLIALADDVFPKIAGAPVAGGDYLLTLGQDDSLALVPHGLSADRLVLGGIHFAPGGAANGRAGGDDVAQFDADSAWDLNFRPSAADPRGMVFLRTPGVDDQWFDKYLLAQDHLNGTSRLDAVIADGRNLPDKITGNGRYARCDYPTVVEIAAHHGKSVPSYDAFKAAAFGTTERKAADERHERTVLIPALSSRLLVQATGERWVWGHDGDPEDPRPSIFGGSWVCDGEAGSRYASLDFWPDFSHDDIGARLRSDHVQLV